MQELTGYHRHCAAYLLRNCRKRRVLTDPSGSTVQLVVGQKNKRRPTARPRLCDAEVQQRIVFPWEYFDQMCGKRLVAMIPDALPALVHHGRIKEAAAVYQKLLRTAPPRWIGS